MVFASPCPRREPLSIYLDQSRWIHLLQARAGSDRVRAGALEALEFLEEAIDSGRAVTSLSVGHYHETWHVYAMDRRYALAELMPRSFAVEDHGTPPGGNDDRNPE